MDQKDWEKIEYFKPQEKWGDPSKMSFNFLKKLDEFRYKLKHPIIITAGYAQGGHSENSFHYKNPCVAADFYLLDYMVSPSMCLLYANQLKFSGIGFYPNGGKWFMHLDIGNRIYQWIRTNNGVYINLNQDTFYLHFKEILKKYGKDGFLKKIT